MAPPDRHVLAAGALLAGTGVALGAFGAHALKSSLSPEAVGWWQTAVAYQMWHAIALLALAGAPLPGLRRPAALLGTGASVFSGTLYAMALTDARWLGAITPAGGALMIFGWAMLAFTAWRGRHEDQP